MTLNRYGLTETQILIVDKILSFMSTRMRVSMSELSEALVVREHYKHSDFSTAISFLSRNGLIVPFFAVAGYAMLSNEGEKAAKSGVKKYMWDVENEEIKKAVIEWVTLICVILSAIVAILSII